MRQITETGRKILNGVLGLSLWAAALAGLAGPRLFNPFVTTTTQAATQAVYLPVITVNSPWYTPFNVELGRDVLSNDPESLRLVTQLNVSQVRMNWRVSWLAMQPEPGDPLDWSQLATFEDELRQLRGANIQPVVIVDEYPRWATDNSVRQDGQPTACGRLQSDKFSNFADFVRQLVQRYKEPQFNVHIWELGNEPDIDPNAVPADNPFGCWGDTQAAYFGGSDYGEMIKVVGQAIKAEDPAAQVWLGGLLLEAPSQNPTSAEPGNFLRGVLEAGAGPYFDVLPYHSYPPYLNRVVDYDNAIGGPWNSLGGAALGKAQFLRQVLQEYGLERPLYLDETSLMCPPEIGGVPTDYCDEPGEDFYQVQADTLVRTFVRASQAGIRGFTWYTLESIQWRGVNMLDPSGQPFPVYTALKTLNERLNGSSYLGRQDYCMRCEAYTFQVRNQRVDVVWTVDNQAWILAIQQAEFIAAYDRNGQRLPENLVNGQQIVSVQFEPVYILRRP